MKYEIPERPSLVRDGHSKALLLNDPSILEQEKARLDRRSKLKVLEERINKIEMKQDKILDILERLEVMHARY